MIKNILSSFRVKSWVGWLAIFGVGGVLFMVPNLFNLAISAFSFSSITAAIFVQNQYFDRKRDLVNPQKSSLPIASGKISPKFSLFLQTILLFTGFILIFLINPQILPIYAIYFALWSFYSSPILHLKNRPTWDILIAGFGSGVFPFLLGVQVSNQLNLEYQFPWMQRYYLDTFLSVLPIFFFQIACQIFQEISDIDADIQTKTKTFVAKYGVVKSLKLALTLALVSLVLPFFFGLFNLGHVDQFLICYSIFLVAVSPLVFFALKLWFTPKKELIEKISRFSTSYSFLLILAVFIYILVLRIYI